MLGLWPGFCLAPMAISVALAADGQAPDAMPGSSAKNAPATDNPEGTQKKTPEQEAPPKKTEYDKLPLPQLIAKANARNPVAQFELASRFNYGRGVPRNTNEALIWLRKSATAGNADAARLLAVKLFNGYDVPSDQPEALYWAKQIAEKGDLPAQLMAANMYANGEGTPRDLVQSYKWFAIAAVAERPGAKKDDPQRDDLLKTAAEQRDKIGSLLTESEERDAQNMASDWWLGKYAPQKGAPAKAKKGKPRKKPGGKPAI
jgi:TPR repeat protein